MSGKVKPIKLSKDLIKELFLKQLDETEFLDPDNITLKLKSIDLKIAEKDMPVIKITGDAFLKVRALVSHCSEEIAWHGLVRKIANSYIIYDILVYPQISRATTVESDDETYPLWIMEQQNIDEMRMQGHSHVSMGVTPSGTDENYYKDLLAHVSDFYIIMIMNKKGDMTLRLYDIPNNLLYYDLSWEIINGSVSYLEWYEEAYKTFVSKPKPVVYPTLNPYQSKIDEFITDEEMDEFDGYYQTPEGFWRRSGTVAPVKPKKGKKKNARLK